MRRISAREALFRLRQEALNGRLRAWPPELPAQLIPAAAKWPAEGLTAVRGTAYAREIESTAEAVLEHRFPLLGLTVDTGREIAWRRDYVSGVETREVYFRRIPYLDATRAGDHKIIWELNRHQHLVLLAQAWLLTGREEFYNEIPRQVESWLAQNRYMRGINWASALEVAFRALSWGWVWRLAGERMAADFRDRFLGALYRHGRYLEHNLSTYFSPNTHLLGEAVALHALGTWFPGFPRAAKWRSEGRRLTLEQMRRQVRREGSHFEQSSYYHVYALDFFLFHHLLEDAGAEYEAGLRRMAEYLGALMGEARRLPMCGDDDGGRVFHPYGERETFGRATLATCAAMWPDAAWPHEREDLYAQAVWWLGPHVAGNYRTGGCVAPRSRLFGEAGVAVMAGGGAHIIADVGPFGAASSGHSHSDTLSAVVRLGREEILVDAGTYTYVGDAGMRNWFRGSAAHNTVRVDGKDQAEPQGPFRWGPRPQAAVRSWRAAPELDWLEGECRYSGIRHRRWFVFLKPELLFVCDEVDGPAGEHLVEQFWHPGERTARIGQTAFQIGSRARLILEDGAEAEFERAWRSRAFGSRIEAPAIRVWRRGTLPVRLAAVLDFKGRAEGLEAPAAGEAGFRLRLRGREGELFLAAPASG